MDIPAKWTITLSWSATHLSPTVCLNHSSWLHWWHLPYYVCGNILFPLTERGQFVHSDPLLAQNIFGFLSLPSVTKVCITHHLSGFTKKIDASQIYKIIATHCCLILCSSFVLHGPHSVSIKDVLFHVKLMMWWHIANYRWNKSLIWGQYAKFIQLIRVITQYACECHMWLRQQCVGIFCADNWLFIRPCSHLVTVAMPVTLSPVPLHTCSLPW